MILTHLWVLLERKRESIKTIYIEFDVGDPAESPTSFYPLRTSANHKPAIFLLALTPNNVLLSEYWSDQRFLIT